MAKILVVDDDFAFTDFARMLLEGMGHEVITCLEGLLAQDAAVLEKPKLIILDLNIPDMDGLMVLQRLKADASTRNIPVFLCSMSRTPPELEEGLRYGAVGYLNKPLETANIMKCVANYL